VTDQNDIAWMEARLVDHPNKTFTDPAQSSADKKRIVATKLYSMLEGTVLLGSC
jgi:hypothetical protein